MKHQFLCSTSSPVVQTGYGKLRGFLYDGVYNFWGVRYAVAKRFHMPEEQPAWEGIRDALAYGYVTPLLTNPAPGNELTVPHRYWPEGEDCLNLNIATPTIDPEAKKPVMVWFHGGGFSDGSGIAHIAFEGDNMARNHDVVMICVNHRLNAFGFLDLSMYGEQYKNSCNVGMADLVAALKWTKENIAAFGGDPDNITIFGQSGGGGKVNAIGQIPDADGLYNKAIVMSGVFAKNSVKAYPTADAKELAEEILKQAHIEPNEIEKLEKLNFRLFIMAVNRAIRAFGKKGMVVNWGPKKNYWYEGDPMTYGFREHFKEIPTIIGTTLGEFSNFKTEIDKSAMTEEQQLAYVREKYKENADTVLDLYKKAYPDKAIVYAGCMDSMVRLGSMQYARLRSTGKHAPVYSYILSAAFELDSGMPAWHNCDIPFVFGNADRIQYCCSTPNSDELSYVMPEAFSRFAHTGDPNFDRIPTWAPADEDHVPTIIFDDKVEVKTDFDRELIEYLYAHHTPAAFAWRAPKDEDEDEGHPWNY